MRRMHVAPLALVLGLSGSACLTEPTKCPPGHKREYCNWIAEAKREETRTARVKQAVEWIAEGRQRNWKYMR